MKISELISELEMTLEDWGDLTVRVATQPSWPLAGKISNVWIDEDGDDDDGNEGDAPKETATPKKVWLAVEPVGHNESPYASRSCWGMVY